MTQKELADAMGISQRSVSAYEATGTTKRPMILSWAFATGVPVEWLSYGVSPEPSGDDGRARRDSNPQPSDPMVDDSVIELFPATRRQIAA